MTYKSGTSAIDKWQLASTSRIYYNTDFVFLFLWNWITIDRSDNVNATYHHKHVSLFNRRLRQKHWSAAVR